MKIVTRRSPIAAYFGALDTRILQLQGSPRRWSVRTAEVVDASGENRQTRVAEQLSARVKDLHLRGKDCLVGLTGDEFAVSLVPVDPHNRSRLQQTLKDTAARAVQDPEGVVFRYLPLAGGEEERDTASVVREEYLLLALGASEMRRCNAAVEHLQWRPVSLEASAFPLARALNMMQEEVDEPWGFLHIGYGHSMFGIMLNGELRFLKPMQLNAEKLIGLLQNTLDREEASASTDELTELIAGGDPGEDEPTQTKVSGETVATLNQKAVGHATEILHALRLEAESLAQEVRACLRHFANRYRGAKLSSMLLSGTGAALPEMETALHNALSLPTSVARPFTELGIEAPEHVISEEHQWCIPLGLALRDWT